MRQTLFRVTAAGVVALVAAALATAAFGAHGHGFGPQVGFRTFGPGGFAPGGPGGPFGFGGPGGPGRGGPGGPGGGGGVAFADVLTPAAAYLGIPFTQLAKE